MITYLLRLLLADVQHLQPRLEEHRCRMLWRGLRVEPPIGSGFCDHELMDEDLSAHSPAPGEYSTSALWSDVYGFEGHDDAMLSLRPALTKKMRELVRRARAEMRAHPGTNTHEPVPYALNRRSMAADSDNRDGDMERAIRSLL